VCDVTTDANLNRLMNITFLGAADMVTGSKHLVHLGGRRILLDCGLFQGFKVLRERNWAPFPVPVKEIDAVVLGHAHLDHSGYSRHEKALPLYGVNDAKRAITPAPRQVFVVHGEPAPADALRIRDELGWAVRVPEHLATKEA
jgi:predicted metal-dependent RNase